MLEIGYTAFGDTSFSLHRSHAPMRGPILRLTAQDFADQPGDRKRSAAGGHQWPSLSPPQNVDTFLHFCLGRKYGAPFVRNSLNAKVHPHSGRAAGSNR